MIRITRRQLLAGLGASFMASPSFSRCAEVLLRDDAVYASAYMDTSKNFGVALLSERGEPLATFALPERGHGFAQARSSKWLVAFARRPGTFALAIDLAGNQQPILFDTPAHTHFYGHGAFSADERLLFASENDFDKGFGVIGVYSVSDGFRRVGEFPSCGVGPHEIITTKRKGILCVANGGIQTHPDMGRVKLNISEMQSSVAFIDVNNGALIESHNVPSQFSQLSLRHMSVDRHDNVWLGGQYEGEMSDDVPLIAKVGIGHELALPQLNPKMISTLSNYIGSMSANGDGSQIAVTSPKGNSVLVIDATSGDIVGIREIEKASGVAAKRDGFAVSTLDGYFDTQKSAYFWDNHLLRIAH